MPTDFSSHARTLVHQYGLDAPGALLTRTHGAAEVLIPPRSGLVGQTAYPGMITESGDLVVLAVQRTGEELAGRDDAGGRRHAASARHLGALDEHLDDPDVLVVDQPDLVRRQAVPLGPGAKRALVVLVGIVILLASGAVPPAVAGLLAAGTLVVSGVVSPTAGSPGRR